MIHRQLNNSNWRLPQLSLCLMVFVLSASLTQAQVVIQDEEITIQSGGLVTIQDSLLVEDYGILKNAGKLVVKSKLQMDTGTRLTGQGRVCFTGANARLKMNGVPLPNLEVDNHDSLRLEDPLTVSDSLTLTSGFIILDTSDLNIDSSTVVLGGGDSSYIQINASGRIKATVGNAQQSLPIGRNPYLPVAISNGGGAVYTVGVKDFVYQNPDKDSNSLTSDVVSETWTIQSSQPKSNVTVSVGWNADQEESGFDRNNCYLSFWEGGVSNQWSGNATSAAAGSGPYFQSRSINFTSNVMYFGVGGASSALPVELILFEGEWQEVGKSVNLFWQTASEINNHSFEVERSLDGLTFHKIGDVQGAGTTYEIMDYAFYDFHIDTISFESGKGKKKNSAKTVLYYRLKQLDFDGAYTYSKVIALSSYNLETNSVQVYPNPSNGIYNISNNTEVESIEVYNVSGLLVHSQNHPDSVINLTFLPSGVYTLRLYLSMAGVVSRRIIRQ